ncbi:sensor histidine kinase [Marinobacter qingdaonensis]|uniref:histidine kinase n=1 Tax=Marinobacter qingdaonensis TaxID=3108486 RepID=A0ABU5NYQ8_9GAMM|nr:ATP-binding protein [Marinobacter sp. ASW11-75]MEA1080944.1 ATP-binding protein [Marinobacter sp. ASW11-75]
MFKALKRPEVWYCYALTLAVALGLVSAAALYDYIQHDATPLGRLPMRVSGCLLGLLLSGSIISLLKRKRTLSKLFAGTTALVASLFCLTSLINLDHLESINPANPLFMVAILLIAISTLRAVNTTHSRYASICSAAIVVSLGFLSLLSRAYDDLAMFTLGSTPEATILASLLLILTGILLPFLPHLYKLNVTDYFPSLLTLSLLGVGVATLSWHTLRIEQSRNLLERAEILANEVHQSYEHAYEDRTLLINRLAGRWAMLEGNDLEHLWQQEVQTYLRDYPDITYLALLEPNFQTRFAKPRDSDSQSGLNPLFSNPVMFRWLNNAVSTGSQRMSPPYFDAFGNYHLALAIPLDNDSAHTPSILAVFDFKKLFDKAWVSNTHSLDFRLSFEHSVVFDTSPNISSDMALPLASQTMDGGDWLIEIYAPRKPMTPGDVYFPPTSLFTGLAVSFLLLLSYLFFRQSDERAEGLAQLNETLSNLFEKEQKLRFTNDRTMQFSRDILASLSAEGVITAVNPACHSVLGYSPAEVIGRKYTELMATEDIETTETRFYQLVAGDDSVSTDFSTRFVRKDGQSVIISWTAAWSELDQTLFCVGRDMTASHEATKQVRLLADRLATIFESITDAVFTLDHQWRFTYVNSKSEELLQAPRDQLLGKSIWTAFPDAIGSTFDKNYRFAVTTGESVSFEAYYAPLNHWLEVSAYPSEEGLTVYYRRINDRKEAEQRLAAAMSELERSNRELEDFAFVASHDLQEPLRKIQTFSDRLLTKSDQFGTREQDYLQRMQSAAARMQRLIEDLLLYSRVATRGQPMVLCDTSSILEEVLQDLETAISREKAVIQVDALPKITGDATQIRQVFQNLLSNAIKFHEPEKPAHVRVFAEDVDTSGWTLVVEDDGIGFDIRYADKLFHPFQRLHSRASYSGTGIGMAIVKKILDRHGADITVNSEPGLGTSFRVRFRQHSTEGQLVDA